MMDGCTGRDWSLLIFCIVLVLLQYRAYNGGKW